MHEIKFEISLIWNISQAWLSLSDSGSVKCSDFVCDRTVTWSAQMVSLSLGKVGVFWSLRKSCTFLQNLLCFPCHLLHLPPLFPPPPPHLPSSLPPPPPHTSPPPQLHPTPSIFDSRCLIAGPLCVAVCLKCNKLCSEVCEHGSAQYQHIADSPVLTRARATVPACLRLGQSSVMGHFNTTGETLL